MIETASHVQFKEVFGPSHFFACDRTEACAVFEYLNRELVVTRLDGAPTPSLITNSPAGESYLDLARYVGFGGNLPIPSGYSSADRFVREAYALAKAKDGTATPVAAAFSALSAALQLETITTRYFTQYQMIFEPKDLRLTYRTYLNPEVQSVSLGAFDLSCKSQVTWFEMGQGSGGDVAGRFFPYSEDLNQKIVLNAAKANGSALPELALRYVAAYPGTPRCLEP